MGGKRVAIGLDAKQIKPLARDHAGGGGNTDGVVFLGIDLQRPQLNHRLGFGPGDATEKQPGHTQNDQHHTQHRDRFHIGLHSCGNSNG